MNLSNEKYNLIYSEYDEIRYRNDYILSQREKEINEKLPEYVQLQDEVSSLSYEYAMDKLHNKEGSKEDYYEKLEQIKQKKETLLMSNGYPADYLSPIYDCPDCKDTGYQDGHKCHCFKKRIIDYLYSQSNLSRILEEENFDVFDISLYPDDYTEESTGMTPKDNASSALKTCKAFCDNFPGHNNLLIYGNTGVGKTFLTHCIAKELLDKEFSVVYLTSTGLFDLLEKVKFDNSASFSEKDASMAYVNDCDLLIIDDLGTEMSNMFTVSQLYSLVNNRLTNNKSIIMSTNLSFSDIGEEYGERIFSRITNAFTFVKLIGDDIRVKKALNRRS